MGFSSAQVASAGFAGQVGGAAMSAVGSYYGQQINQIGVDTQAQNVKHQAAMDVIGAKSSALTLTGNADIALLNSQAQYNATLAGADFSVLSAQSQAFDMIGQAKLNAVRASGQATSLEISAQGDDMQARLAELMAQSDLLRGERNEQASRLQYAQAKGKANVQFARGNIDLGQGSALAVRNSLDLSNERAAIAIEQDTMLAAFGHRSQSAQASLSAHSKRAQAGALMASASLETALAESKAAYTVKMADINANATRTLAAAGMVTARAENVYKHTVAGIMVDNASAAALVTVSRAPMYSGSAGASFFSSLLSSAPGVARSWYDYLKT